MPILCPYDLVSGLSLQRKIARSTQLLTRHCFHRLGSFLAVQPSNVDRGIAQMDPRYRIEVEDEVDRGLQRVHSLLTHAGADVTTALWSHRRAEGTS